MSQKALDAVKEARRKLPNPDAYRGQTYTVAIRVDLDNHPLKPLMLKVTFRKIFWPFGRQNQYRSYYWDYLKTEKLEVDLIKINKD